MRSHLQLLAAIILCASLAAIHAQPAPRGAGMMGPQMKGPNLGGSNAKLFGDNTSFTANMEMQGAGAGAGLTGKLSVNEGKSRFEIDMTKAAAGSRNPQAAAMMKTMGMDTMVMVSRPDKKVNYMIYPGMNAYCEISLPDAAADTNAANYKIETTELGKETVDGHPCVKNKAVVTDDKGATHESTVWNATDLKNFPVKIESVEGGGTTTMAFKDVKLAKPEAAVFDPPSGATKYNDMQTMMMQEMMKRRGGN